MKRNIFHVLACAAAAVMLSVANAAQGATETDDKIESAFKKTYVFTAYLSADAIRVEARDGVVTLTGTVADESHRTLAQETAAGLPGVTRVDNELVISGETAAESVDAAICRKVMLALQFHRSLTAGRIGVEVKDGFVTLRGVAVNAPDKDLVSECAADLDGVKQVRNEMVIVAPAEQKQQTMGETLDDASINAQIVTALMTHRSTRSVITRVATHHGEVTLTGIAMNAAQSALIVKHVSEIYGVTRVINQMTIENVPGPK